MKTTTELRSKPSPIPCPKTPAYLKSAPCVSVSLWTLALLDSTGTEGVPHVKERYRVRRAEFDGSHCLNQSHRSHYTRRSCKIIVNNRPCHNLSCPRLDNRLPPICPSLRLRVVYTTAHLLCTLHHDPPDILIISFSSSFRRAVNIISSRRRCRSACRSFLFCDHAFPVPFCPASVLVVKGSESFDARL